MDKCKILKGKWHGEYTVIDNWSGRTKTIKSRKEIEKLYKKWNGDLTDWDFNDIKNGKVIEAITR